MDITYEKLSELIVLHMSDNKIDNHKWKIGTSNLSGRGVFANCDFKTGEVIFREKPLLLGPTGRIGSKTNTCTICYRYLDENDLLCKKGCSLPICIGCTETDQHKKDCELYKSLEPIESDTLNHSSLRALIVLRGLFLNDSQKELIYAMQANADPGYRNEIRKAAKCFKKFPTDVKTVEYFHRIVSVLNTNAFESLSQKDNHETGLRGLYPLSAIMNHICTPNTSHIYQDTNEMIVKATKDIRKGEELFTTYTKLLWSNMTRRLFLNMTKQFSCECRRCCDPTENGSYISALFCRQNDCSGWIIPITCELATSPWKCIKCKSEYSAGQICKIQDFIMAMVKSKSTSKCLKEIITFINEKSPKICPKQSQFIMELKLNVIWRVSKSDENFSKKDIQDVRRYCDDVLEVVSKLDAGECTMKLLLLEEMERFDKMLNNMKDYCNENGFENNNNNNNYFEFP